MSSATTTHRKPVIRSQRSLGRVLSLRGVLRMRPVADTWRRSAVAGLLAIGLPEVLLLATGHLNLAFFTCAGGLCALYGHVLPYGVRERVLAWVVLAMTAGVGIALLSSALIESAVLRIVVVALLAGAYKVGCDASRVGPPGNILFTFIMCSASFLPVRLADIPLYLLLTLLGGLLAWVVNVAPSLVRPHDPERLAVAQALEATARLLDAETDVHPARNQWAGAVHAAWRTVRQVRAFTASGAAELSALRALLVRAETCATTPVSGDADLLRAWARDLRKSRPAPQVRSTPAEEAELRGLAAEQAAESGENGFRRVARAFRPGSAELPIGLRVAVGGIAAGWISLAVGVDRPYWAVMTAAVVTVGNTVLSWQRTLQRVLGNVVGLLLFLALIPLLHPPIALVIVALCCQLVVEATISRNYWIAQVFVTPMALIMSEFAARNPGHELARDRLLDTCVGAVVAVLMLFLVPNRRVSSRVDVALRNLEVAVAAGEERGMHRATRARLSESLVALRESADTAAGEWWGSAVPEERIVEAERAGHRLLAASPNRAVPVG